MPLTSQNPPADASSHASSIHVWVPGIRDGSGGIQALSRYYINALLKTFPNAHISIFVKNDTPETSDPLCSERVTFYSAAAWPAPLRTLAFTLYGLFHGIKDDPQFALTAHLNFLPAMSPLRWLRDTPIACILHGIEAWRPLPSLKNIALQKADLLISVSQFTQQKAAQLHGLNPKKMRVIPNTFDVDQFAPGPKPQALLDRYQLQADQPVLFTVSRLANSERFKGHIEVLHALPAIRKHFPTLRYLIGGQGPFADSLKQIALTLGIQDLVIFTGFVAKEELCDHYRLCDVFVMPSQKEGFGIVFLEAMASGKPTIAGNLDGSVDALDGGRLGALVNPQDSTQIAQVLIEILSHRHSNTLLFQPDALREAVVQTFGPQAFNQRVKEAFTTMIECSTSRLPPGSLTTDLHSSSDTTQLQTPLPQTPNQHRPSVTILTQLTSPYQVEFFNAIAAQGQWDLSVVYLTSHDRNRFWKLSDIQHRHLILSENPNSRTEALRWVLVADLTVFNYYTDTFALRAIRHRNASQKTWVFWGERPGSLLLGWPTSLLRRLALLPLTLGKNPIWGVGRFAIDGYKADFGTSRPYTNLPYFSNLERFRTQPRQPQPGTVRFLFTGTLSKRKGVDLLAKAFLQLALKHPQTRLTLVGVGPLESKIRSILAPVSNQVDFKGFTPWQDLPKAYACADVFCFPSHYDGWGLALVEAMASGLPVISTPQTGSAREFVIENVNGWIIPPGDATALHQAMLNALTAPLAAIGHSASLAVSNHTLEQGAHRFIDAAQDALISISNAQ